MPVNLPHTSSHCCAVALLLSSDSNPGLFRPRGKEPGRAINDSWLHIPSELAGPAVWIGSHEVMSNDDL